VCVKRKELEMEVIKGMEFLEEGLSGKVSRSVKGVGGRKAEFRDE